jgi:hypothetical protein
MSERQTYVMDNSPITVAIDIDPRPGKKKIAEHKFRLPTFEEEEVRERQIVSFRKEGAKVEDTNAILEETDDEKANINFYNKLIEGFEKDVEIPANTLVGEQELKELIPTTHKVTAVLGMTVSTFELDLPEDDDDFEFELGTSGSAGREWRLIQKIGGQFKRDDGTLQPPDYEITYILREPTEKERHKYKSNAVNTQRWYSKAEGGVVERSSINLKTLTTIFDNTIKDVENASVVDGEGSIPLDVRNPDHLAKIPARFKKTVVIRLFNALDADLGN